MTSSHPRRRIVGVSLKMYFNLQRTATYISSCLPLHALAATKSIEIFIIPDFLSLAFVSGLPQAAPSIRLGAQDCFWEDSGAYTGEVSPMCLKNFGCFNGGAGACGTEEAVR
jgi:triosephosphate isomerase